MFYPVEKLRNKLYQNRVHFKEFKTITDESIEKIDKLIEKHFNNFVYTGSQQGSKLDRYCMTLSYLNAQYNLSYDEKLLFLIRVCDPQCITLKFYRASGIRREKI